MKYAVCFQQLVSLPSLLLDQPKWLHSMRACCRGGRLCVRTSHLLPWASRLCLPDTHWWLNGCVWVQDDDLGWRRRHAGQRWCADIRASWFDGDKKDAQGPGPQTCCHWHGLGWADEKWVTATQMRNILQPKSPCTLFCYKEAIYYKYCRKACGAVEFVASLRTQLLSWKQCPSVTMCQKPVPHAWGTAVTFHMTIIICSLLFVAISGKRSRLGINQVERICARVSVCRLLDVNKNTSLKHKVIKRC